MPSAFFFLPVVYTLVMLAGVAVVVIALWRIMKAQEATANALQKIAIAFAQRPSPPS